MNRTEKPNTSKEEYIGRYLERKMKGNTLPYGLQYLNLVADLEQKAEKLYNKKYKS